MTKAKFSISMPDGLIYDVEAPPGTTEGEARARILQDNPRAGDSLRATPDFQGRVAARRTAGSKMPVASEVVDMAGKAIGSRIPLGRNANNAAETTDFGQLVPQTVSGAGATVGAIAGAPFGPLGSIGLGAAGGGLGALLDGGSAGRGGVLTGAAIGAAEGVPAAGRLGTRVLSSSGGANVLRGLLAAGGLPAGLYGHPMLGALLSGLGLGTPTRLINAVGRTASATKMHEANLSGKKSLVRMEGKRGVPQTVLDALAARAGGAANESIDQRMGYPSNAE